MYIGYDGYLHVCLDVYVNDININVTNYNRVIHYYSLALKHVTINEDGEYVFDAYALRMCMVVSDWMKKWDTLALVLFLDYLKPWIRHSMPEYNAVANAYDEVESILRHRGLDVYGFEYRHC